MGAAKNNRYNQKYTKEEAITIFEQAVEFSKTSDCLSVQDAIIHVDVPHTTFYNLCKLHKELNNIKEEINQNIIARINRGGLTNELNTTACIWRMKQLGERDKTEVQQTVTDISPLTDEERRQARKANEDLLNDY